MLNSSDVCADEACIVRLSKELGSCVLASMCIVWLQIPSIELKVRVGGTWK